MVDAVMNHGRYGDAARPTIKGCVRSGLGYLQRAGKVQKLGGGHDTRLERDLNWHAGFFGVRNRTKV
jgi:hypothetical protein